MPFGGVSFTIEFMDESPAIRRARLRADECRRRELELSSGEPITQEDIDNAMRRAAEARASAEVAKATATKVLTWLAELRKEFDRAVLRAEETRTEAEQARVAAAATLAKFAQKRSNHNLLRVVIEQTAKPTRPRHFAPSCAWRTTQPASPATPSPAIAVSPGRVRDNADTR